MKNIILSITLLLTVTNLFSTGFELVKTFPFDHPFGFDRNWDRIEGYPEGPAGIIFFDGNILIPDNTEPGEWRVFNANWYEINSILTPNGGFLIFPLYSFGIGDLDVGFRVYTRHCKFPDTPINTAIIKSESKNISYSFDPLFLTENYLFAQTNNNELISWELLSDGKYTYRNVDETKALLSSEVGEQLGYHTGPFNYYSYFGDFKYGFSPYHMAYIVRDLIFPQGEQYPKNLENFDYIGIDSKGLNYYWGLGPVPVDPRRQDKNDYDYQVIVAIIDTWTKKVTFRMMDKDAWTPPKDERNNLIGIFPKAIHPNGDVYFFDADEEKQEYELKRLKNDWWAEMGVDQRNIARITSNHIPLRTEQNNVGGNNGYNFANEYVWILDEGNSAVDESGNATKWIQIQKIDGRKGWIYESEVYWE